MILNLEYFPATFIVPPFLLLLLFSHPLCSTLCKHIACSTPGFPVPHRLLEFSQVHVHCIGDDCHSAISSSDTLFSFCHQSFPASRTLWMNHLFSLDDQDTGASASVLPENIQDWAPLRLTVLIFLRYKTFRSLLQRHSSKASILWYSALFKFSSHNCTWPLGRW